MKKIILLSCVILLVTNLLFGAILSSYGWYNVALSCAVILTTGIMLYLIDSIHLKDGYKVSLTVLFIIAGALEFFFSLFAPNRFTNNWWLVFVAFITAFEAVLLIITNILTDKSGHA